MSFEVVEFEERADWLKQRQSGIGSSDIAGILGISPWTTPFQVWASKVYEMPEEEETESMRWGKILENVILDEWGRLNQPVTDRGQLLRASDVPIMLATPDGLTTTPDGLPAIAEAKNTNDWRWDEIPPHYYAQAQWQIAVAGFDVGYLVALHGGRHLETYELEADQALITEMILAAGEFWKLVEADEPPPTEGADSPMLASLWPRDTIKAVEVPRDAAIELYEARSARDAGKDRYEAATARIKEIMRDAGEAVYDQQVIATWRETNSTRYFRVKGDGLDG